MAEVFQRLIRPEPEALSLGAQAALGPVREPRRTQFAHLLRLFLERFFNHETASPDGDSKARVVLIAFAAGLPPVMVAMYLWPIYHPFIGWPPGKHPAPPPSYWLQVSHHFFFVIYSFVAIGIATVFEWDLLFPDLLDLFVLGPLPIPRMRIFFARVAAISLFVGGFLLDTNCMAPIVLLVATDPPSVTRFFAGHIAAVVFSGLFAAAFLLAIEGILLASLGERLFRKVSLAAQGVAIAALLVLLLLFPVFSAVVPPLLQAGNRFAYLFPPFWFLGIYQRLMEGPAALPIYARLAQIGCAATLLAVLLAILAYPLAYARKVRELIIGPGAVSPRRRASAPLERILNGTLVQSPVRRAVFHFISQTILRVPRYRIYLVLYGGVGLSLVTATVLRFSIAHGHVRAYVSADGIRAVVPIIAFWIMAGLRMAFVSPGNQRGSWVFSIVHGKPAHLPAAVQQQFAASQWAFFICAVITLAFTAFFQAISPPELHTRTAIAALDLVAVGLCLLLADIFFLNVLTIPFTGELTRDQPNLALSIMKYYFCFPIVIALSAAADFCIESRAWHSLAAIAVIAGLHLLLRARRRRILREHCDLPALEDDEDDFPMKLGLRY